MKLQHDQPAHSCQECDIRDEVIDDLRKQLAEAQAEHECTMKNWEYACADARKARAETIKQRQRAHDLESEVLTHEAGWAGGECKNCRDKAMMIDRLVMDDVFRAERKASYTRPPDPNGPVMMSLDGPPPNVDGMARERIKRLMQDEDAIMKDLRKDLPRYLAGKMSDAHINALLDKLEKLPKDAP